MHTLSVSLFALTALFPISSLAQSTASVVPADGTLPNCVPLCAQVKFNEAPMLAPNCDVNDLFCLCTTSPFVMAYRRCLYDNCASDDEVMLGRQTWASICADSGASLMSFSAIHDSGAAQTAVDEVASILAVPVSGATIPSPSFYAGSAVAQASVNHVVQTSAAVSAAGVQLSRAAVSASISLQQEAYALSASVAAAERQASAVEAALETQLSGSSLSAAEAQISQTLSMIRVAASQKLESDADAVQASLASQSNAIFNPTPTGQVNAKSSAGLRDAVLSLTTTLSLAVVGAAAVMLL